MVPCQFVPAAGSASMDSWVVSSNRWCHANSSFLAGRAGGHFVPVAGSASMDSWVDGSNRWCHANPCFLAGRAGGHFVPVPGSASMDSWVDSSNRWCHANSFRWLVRHRWALGWTARIDGAMPIRSGSWCGASVRQTAVYRPVTFPGHPMAQTRYVRIVSPHCGPINRIFVLSIFNFLFCILRLC